MMPQASQAFEFALVLCSMLGAPNLPNLPNLIDTVFFDLDGTLVDTELAASQTVRGCFAQWGIPLSEADAGYVAGRTWESACEYLFQKYPPPLAPAQARELLVQGYRAQLEKHLVIVPGAQQAVRSLAAQGLPLALVSGSHRAEIFFALDRLGVRDLFQVVLGAEDYAHSKPAPDGYLKALQLLGRDPRRTLVFEDSQAGIASALAAGAWVVAITGTNHFGQDTSQAHFRIQDLTPVNPRWLSALKFSGLSAGSPG